jgi:hypothetical protein
MKALASLLFLAAAVAGGQAYATCSYPQAPTKIPDGATATKEEMIEGMKAVKAYNDQIKAYTDCLRLEHDQEVAKIDPKDDPGKTKAQKAELDSVLVKKNDAAVDAATAVTNRFNEQVKIYKAKADKSKG